VALEDGVFASRFGRRPRGLVRGLPSAGTIGGAQAVEGFGDAEQRRSFAGSGRDGLGGEPQQPGPAVPGCRCGIVGDLHQPAEVGMEHVGVVGEQFIGQPGRLCVTGQRPQQVTGGFLPLTRPPARQERVGERLLIVRPWGNPGPGVQQGVVERLVEQPVGRPGTSLITIECGADGRFDKEVGRRGPDEPG
jgi:hypothetical protein